jgi:hypothetical protein
MQVTVDVKDWKLTTDQEKKERRIEGSFVVKAGATIIAEQQFNSNYGGTKILFPAEIMAEIEKINDKIVQAITKNFVSE